MTQKQLILAALSVSESTEYTPVQVQKLFFLIDRNVGNQIVGGPFFNFVPYHYGPFDKEVYNQLKELSETGDVSIEMNQGDGMRKYKLTEEGIVKGKQWRESLDDSITTYIAELNSFVIGIGFTDLVASIYQQYPEMKVNSIFQKADNT
ncbi:MAG: hypothetical protein IH950_15545 [Bacteroidetes bacterium]|nr:hypothetical protein [Bacteroidota bacterium]